MNFIKYFFSEIFRLFKLLVGATLVLAVGFLIYKLFFSEPDLAQNYEQNRVQILSLRDFAREKSPREFLLTSVLAATRFRALEP